MHRHGNEHANLLQQVLNLRVIGGALLISFLLFCSTLSLLWITQSRSIPEVQTTAVLSVIRAPLVTASPVTPPPGTNPTGAASVPPSPPPGMIALGSYVQIVGTSGEGLRLRAEPGLNNQVLLLGSESEVFRVADGPKDMDGYTWWYLVGPFDTKRYGWAVSNYLMVVQNP
jgi:hypothetical protein